MNVFERMEQEGSKEIMQRFIENQKMPYEQKKYHAMSRVVDFYRRCEQEGYNFHVSVGGLDSIVLYMFINFSPLLDHYRYCIPRGSVPGISASYLEDPSIIKVHKALGIECVKPIEKRPHRFDLLRERNQKQWDNLMYHLVQDDNGDWFGWAKVLDYIGVDYL